MSLSKEIRTYLSKIYYDPSNSASFSSPQRLYDYVRDEGKFEITLKEIQNYLNGEEVYTTHVEPKKAKHFYGMQVPYSKYLVQLDSFYFDFEGEPKKRFILGVDVFSRKAAARAVENLKSETVNRAVREIIAELQPQRLMFDKGREYNNSLVLSTLRDNNIKYIVANQPYKASNVERLGRSIKNLLYKALQSRGISKWSEILPKTIDAYNNRKHRMIGMTPNEAHNKENEAQIWFRTRDRNWKSAPRPHKYKYEINDPCRIVSFDGPLKKSYFQTFSTQVFFISARYSKSNVHRYHLKDAQNNPVENRSFTKEQIKLVNITSDSIYRIERVLHQKIIRGTLYSYVKWVDYPDSFNSYIPSTDVVRLS